MTRAVAFMLGQDVKAQWEPVLRARQMPNPPTPTPDAWRLTGLRGEWGFGE